MTDEMGQATDTTSRLPGVRELIEALGDPDLGEWGADIQVWMGYIGGVLAEHLLKYNRLPKPGEPGTNRTLVRANIKSIQGALLKGDWYFNHQGLAFDVDGNLIDGQHRLVSIVNASKLVSDIQVPLMIVTGLPSAAMKGIDLTRRRSVGTHLRMRGYASSGLLSTSLRLLHAYETMRPFEPFNEQHWKQVLTLEEAERILEKYPLTLEGTKRGSFVRHQFNAAAATAGWTLCRVAYPEGQSEEFLKGLHSGANLPEGDSRLVLRRWAENQRRVASPGGAPVALAMYLKAFKAFHKGESVGLLGFKTGVERFPRVP